jgi:hypothetical protein
MFRRFSQFLPQPTAGTPSRRLRPAQAKAGGRFADHGVRSILIAAALLSAPLLGQAQSPPGFVYENDSESQTLAELNGDGAVDLVVLDKASGQFRVAEGQGDGTLVWRDNPGDSGLSPATGFSAGPVLDPSYEQLVVSAERGNRIQIIDAQTGGRLTQPLRVPDTLRGPAVVTALNIPDGPSGYDPDFFDIAYHATLEDPGDPNLLQFFRNDGSGLPFPDRAEGKSSDLPPRGANRIELEAGNLPVYGVLNDTGSGTLFRLLDPRGALASSIDEIGGLPGGAAYVYADFDGDAGAEFLFYRPGSATLYESEWTGSGLSALTPFSYPAAIAELRIVQSAGQPQLLVIHDGRDQADRVDYDGSGSFSVRENFPAEGDLPIRGALSVQDKLHLLDGSGRSASLRSFAFDGNNAHQLIDKQKLTPLRSGGAGSTVLLFDSAPLQDPDARLLARYDAGPWTSAFRLGPSSVEVESERFRGASEGLGDPQVEVIQGLPAAAGGALTNQIDSDTSIFFQDGAIGDMTAELSVSPPSGTYGRALRPVFDLTGEGKILYRTSTRIADWTPITDTPPLILDDTTLYAVAVNNDEQFSNIVTVDYVITGEPDTRDSDGDGLPDFAALEAGLDPLAADDDADGDGFTDFQEVIAGTDPTNAASKPSRSGVSFEYPNSFDLLAAPAVPNPAGGTTPLRPRSSSGVDLVVHQPGGSFLDRQTTAPDGSLGYPVSRFEALGAVGDERFLVTASALNFQVDDGGSPRDYGRQVAALAKIPPLEFSPFAYSGFGDNGGYGNLSAETADWRAAAQAYFSSLQRPEIVRDPVGPESTLELLLVETILGRLLYDEGFSDRTELTLTPFRSDENPLAAIPVGDPLPDPAPNPARDRQLNATLLEQRKRALGASGSPFYGVDGIIDTVRSELADTSTTGIQQLKELAARLYTASATTSGAALRQPLPALRQFIRSGSLTNTGYDDVPASGNFPASLRADASQGINDIIRAIQPRPTETVTLYVEGGEATAACPTWKEVLYTSNGFDPDSPILTGSEYALLDAQGDRYPVTRAFPLTSGSVFQVTGYVLDEAPCGDIALEVITRPELAFLRNSSARDQDGNLIPDAIEARNPDAAFSPFDDTDGDGYTDLQEILDGSDPDNPANRPMDGGSPAAVAEVGPPQLRIVDNGPTSAAIKFDYPAEYVPYVEFELHSTSDLNTAFSPTGEAANHTGSGEHEQLVNQSGDSEFYIFRMQLK